jgi:hypothetical protein
VDLVTKALGATFVVSLTIATPALVIGYASAQGKPSYGCGPGFDFHVTLAQAAALPKSQKAIDDGLTTLDDLLALYRGYDKNGNGMLCMQEPPGWVDAAQRPLVEYLYNFVDDAASSPNGR